jgi:hypothetical protein
MLYAAYLPGRVQIKVSFLVPAMGRESTASGVCLRPSFNSACAIPGASRCSNGLIDSGVTSRGPNPVPPEVSIRSQPCGDEVQSVIALRISPENNEDMPHVVRCDQCITLSKKSIVVS